MNKYIILEKGLFEKLVKFEERINSKYGYEAISLSRTDSGYAVLMKKAS
ncbi:hypothetical protein N8368_04600 [Bacteroidia bacterium]|nr:hypothetical protein [Bacteroidia bacterium]MDC1395765.1 hypothetical protein [Bacteroidia bacterium]